MCAQELSEVAQTAIIERQTIVIDDDDAPTARSLSGRPVRPPLTAV